MPIKPHRTEYDTHKGTPWANPSAPKWMQAVAEGIKRGRDTPDFMTQPGQTGGGGVEQSLARYPHTPPPRMHTMPDRPPVTHPMPDRPGARLPPGAMERAGGGISREALQNMARIKTKQGSGKKETPKKNIAQKWNDLREPPKNKSTEYIRGMNVTRKETGQGGGAKEKPLILSEHTDFYHGPNQPRTYSSRYRNANDPAGMRYFDTYEGAVNLKSKEDMIREQDMAHDTRLKQMGIDAQPPDPYSPKANANANWDRSEKGGQILTQTTRQDKLLESAFKAGEDARVRAMEGFGPKGETEMERGKRAGIAGKLATAQHRIQVGDLRDQGMQVQRNDAGQFRIIDPQGNVFDMDFNQVQLNRKRFEQLKEDYK